MIVAHQVCSGNYGKLTALLIHKEKQCQAKITLEKGNLRYFPKFRSAFGGWGMWGMKVLVLLCHFI